ncbi:MAG: hypothetical protein ACXWQO_05055 [Bdellovibrionota bacterium]
MSWHYLYVFWQSNLLEVGIYYLFYKKQLSLGRTFAVVTLANSVTHPLVFFGFMASSATFLVAILAAEAFAVAAETCLHSYGTKLSTRRTFPAALAANLFSWQLAPMFTYWLFLMGENGS